MQSYTLRTNGIVFKDDPLPQKTHHTMQSVFMPLCSPFLSIWAGPVACF